MPSQLSKTEAKTFCHRWNVFGKKPCTILLSGNGPNWTHLEMPMLLLEPSPRVLAATEPSGAAAEQTKTDHISGTGNKMVGPDCANELLVTVFL